jgi:hypothetical protein
MSTAVAVPSLRPSFYSPIPESVREDHLVAYREFLGRRNGDLDYTKGFSKREEWMREAGSWHALVDEVGHVAFNRMAVGPTGLSVARTLAGKVLAGKCCAAPTSSDAVKAGGE